MTNPRQVAGRRGEGAGSEEGSSLEVASGGSRWRVWLLRVVAVASPLLFAAISVTAEQLSLRGDLELMTRNRVINANLFLAVAASVTGGLFCRDRWRARIGDALRAGVYAFVVYLVVVLLSVRIIE